jgi:hypothetical protein
MQRRCAHRNQNKFRRRPTLPVVQSLAAGAQVHPGAAAVLRAVFVADERAFTGARCELPLGEVVEVTGRKRRSSPSAESWISAAMATAE